MPRKNLTVEQLRKRRPPLQVFATVSLVKPQELSPQPSIYNIVEPRTDGERASVAKKLLHLAATCAIVDISLVDRSARYCRNSLAHLWRALSVQADI